MSDVRHSAIFACGIAAVAAATLAVAFLAPRPATALPAYAKQTGLACGRCHVSPAGGGPNTAFGKAFAANGHKVPGKTAAKGGKAGGKAAGKSAGKAAPAATETAAAPAAAPGCSGGYYSPSCNPHFGEQPEIDYSTALSFKVFPKSN